MFANRYFSEPEMLDPSKNNAYFSIKSAISSLIMVSE